MDAARPSRPTRAWILLGLCAAIGAALRLRQLGAQVVGDDEWHSLLAVRDHGLSWILSHFGASDHCIPLTAIDWLLAHTIGLSELWMRALPFTAGLAALIALPLLVARHVGTRAALWFALLLAIAPLHVHYSRLARPYEITFALALAAVLAHERWWSGGARAWAWTWALCAALAIWFHAVVAPFVLAPVAGALMPGAARDALARLRRRQTVLLGGAAGLLAFLLLLPALLTDFDALNRRSFARADGWPKLEACLQLAAGTRDFTLTAISGALAAGGLYVLFRRHGQLARWLLVPCALQALALAVARPAMLQEAPVLVRYLLPAHGVFLLALALGLVALDDLVRRAWPRIPRELAPLALVGWTYARGPLPAIYGTTNTWTAHCMYQLGYGREYLPDYARIVLGVKSVPPIYAELARACGPDESLLEAPWYSASHLTPYPLYQRVHQRPFVAGFVTPRGEPPPVSEVPLGDGRFRLEHCADALDPAALRARGVRFALFHRAPPIGLDGPDYVDLRHVEAAIARYREVVGPPRHEDAALCVFDLARTD